MILPRGTESNISEGEHLLALTAIEVKRIKSAYPDGADGMADVMVFTWTSSTKDENGVRETFDTLLPPKITDKNKTGKLLTKMLPGVDVSVDDIDTDDLIGLRFTAHIVLDEKQRPQIVKIAPAKKPAKPAPPVDDDDSEAPPAPKPPAKPAPKPDKTAGGEYDPFADE
jgi:hypothetical protein